MRILLKEGKNRIGRNAILLAMLEDDESSVIKNQLSKQEWKYCIGKVGAMELKKVLAAIETAAKREGLVDGHVYREMHALYHATIEAMYGITRGQIELGGLHRTAGLRFSVVTGEPYDQKGEGKWIAVALYGTIGAPIPGHEHETIGLGINHM